VGRVVPSDASNLMLIEGDMARIVASRGYEQFNMQEEYSNMQMPAHRCAPPGDASTASRCSSPTPPGTPLDDQG